MKLDSQNIRFLTSDWVASLRFVKVNFLVLQRDKDNRLFQNTTQLVCNTVCFKCKTPLDKKLEM